LKYYYLLGNIKPVNALHNTLSKEGGFVPQKATYGSNDLKKGDRVCLTMRGGHQFEATVRCRMNPCTKHPGGGFRLPGDQYCSKNPSSNGQPPQWEFHNMFCAMKVVDLKKIS